MNRVFRLKERSGSAAVSPPRATIGPEVVPGSTHMGVMRRADLVVPLVRGFLG